MSNNTEQVQQTYTSTTNKPSSSLSSLAWRKFRRSHLAYAGLIVTGFLLFIAIFAPLLAPTDPNGQILEYSVKESGFTGNVLYKENPASVDIPTPIAIQSFMELPDSVRYVDIMGSTRTIDKSQLVGSSSDDWYAEPTFYFGTDRYGRDVLSRLLYGARISMSVGLISQGIALGIGVVLGALAGFFRGWVDDVVMWLINVVWSFPSILLVIAFSVALGQGFWQTFVAIGIASWVEIARIVRGQFFSLREREFVEATHALGFGTLRIIFRHVLPNAIGPITVIATAGFANAIVAEAGLSFLGLGVQPPTASWGQMVRDGYGYIAAGVNWGLTLFPGFAIAISVFAFNLVGDGLRDALDPRTLTS